jgi:fucose permease
MTTKTEKTVQKVLPLMLAFFVMGFVDLVGTAANYVKTDLNLSDTLANLLPSLVFFWFLVFAVPTGLMMNRIGRRNTVILSLMLTSVSLLLPVISYGFVMMMISFCLLGIGNTLLQVSVNPLISNVVSGDKLASSLTLGQFFKAIASFLAPIIASWSATKFGDWKLLFPIFMVIAILATVLLGVTKIEEQKENNKGSTFFQCFSLLGNGFILLCFIGIICHVGIDVGVNTTIPKIFMERLSISLTDAGIATSIYFLFRTVGAFLGTFILARYQAKTFFFISVFLMILAILGFLTVESRTALYVCVSLIGLGNSNIFSIVISKAMLYKPDKKNEISGLMIMGLCGGTIFPLMMGVASDAAASQNGAIAVIGIAVFYLIFFSFRLKK